MACCMASSLDKWIVWFGESRTTQPRGGTPEASLVCQRKRPSGCLTSRQRGIFSTNYNRVGRDGLMEPSTVLLLLAWPPNTSMYILKRRGT